MTLNRERLITSRTVEEYFQDSVDTALNNQGIEADSQTVYYVVNLLTMFTRADALYERTQDGLTLKPLALMYADALESSSEKERNLNLRRLGDVALFISGLFSQSLSRKVVDVDYYVSMGGGAYGYLSSVMRGSSRGHALVDVFDELSTKFQEFVDVLSEVSDNTHLGSDTDILRAYEVWVRTGSKRVARQLRQMGLHLDSTSVSRRKH